MYLDRQFSRPSRGAGCLLLPSLYRPSEDSIDGQPEDMSRAGRATLTHVENLNNLREVSGLRFEFYAFPLKLVPAAGSPVRAVGIIDN